MKGIAGVVLLAAMLALPVGASAHDTYAPTAPAYRGLPSYYDQLMAGDTAFRSHQKGFHPNARRS